MGSSDESRFGVEIKLQTGPLPLDLLGGAKCPSVGLLILRRGQRGAILPLSEWESKRGADLPTVAEDGFRGGKEKGLKSSRASATSSRSTLLFVVDHNGIHGFVLHVSPLHVDGDGLAAGRDHAAGGEHGFAAFAVGDLPLV